eukprot:TRINITY_DN5661_c0_g1_i1.p1 TRINITY_DN5661_c0_g1~~TRINITY_DN5661_c0_g1_i1.p1  ORF type:complete len:1110 (+),score=254.45 TRINITY_DN5661_c0_g1_i1:25-3354(+)
MRNTKKKLKFEILCHKIDQRGYFEYASMIDNCDVFEFREDKMNRGDMIVIPVANTYGVINQEISDFVDIVERSCGSFYDRVTRLIQTEYLGEQPVGNPIFVPLSKGNLKYVCWVPVSRSPKSIPFDFGFNCLWSALVQINRQSDINDVETVMIIDPAIYASEKGPIYKQVTSAITSYQADPIIVEDIEFAIHRDEEIRVIKELSRRDKKKELEGLLWSRQLEKRGLFSLEELSICLEWISDSKSSLAISAGAAIGNLLRKPETPFTISAKTIMIELHNSKEAVKNLIDMIVSESVTIHEEIDPINLEQGDVLGEGNAGVVTEGTYNGLPVALKFFHEKDNSEDFWKELAMLCLIQSEYILHCYGAVTLNSESYITITELMECSLFDIVHDETLALSDADAVNMSLQIAKCMSFFHKCGLIHRDLKSLNLLVNKHFQIKLCDFGLSRVKSKEQMTSHVGTMSWIAPELLVAKSYTEKADVYSFGIIMWEIVARKIPFEEKDPFSIPHIVPRGERPPIPRKCHPKYKNIMKKSWHPRFNKRPSFDELIVKLDKLFQTIDKTNCIIQIKSRLEGDIKRISATYGDLSSSTSSLHSNGKSSNITTISGLSSMDSSVQDTSTNIQITSQPTASSIFPEVSENVNSLVQNYFNQLQRNIDHGTLESNGNSYILVSRDCFAASLDKMIKDTFHHEDSNFIKAMRFDIGHSIGYGDFDSMGNSVDFASITHGIFALAPYLSHTGLAKGSFSETNMIIEDDKIILLFECEKSNECNSSPDLSCCFLSGYISGWMSACYGDYISAIEISCCSKNSSVCRFVISNVSQMGRAAQKFRKIVKKEKVEVPEYISNYYKQEWFENALTEISGGVEELDVPTATIPSNKKKSRRRKDKREKVMSGSLLSNVTTLMIDPAKCEVKMADQPLILIRADAITKDLYENYLSAFSEINPKLGSVFSSLFASEIGRLIGSTTKTIMDTIISDNLTADKTMNSIFSFFGWGNAKLDDISVDDRMAFQVSIKHNFEKKYSHKSKLNCFLVPGFLSGLFSPGDVEAIEVECGKKQSTPCTVIVSHPTALEGGVREYYKSSGTSSLKITSRARKLGGVYQSKYWIKDILQNSF